MPEGEPETEIVFYDSLDAMLMALNAGDITYMSVYNSTADYLVANNRTNGNAPSRSSSREGVLFFFCFLKLFLYMVNYIYGVKQ